MQRQTHIVFGILLASVLWAIFDFEVGVVVFAALGSILPDMDFKKEIRKYHRKLFHNVWFIAAVFPLTYFGLEPVMAFGFLIGSASHLIVDSLTPTGIWPFWPNKRHYCLNRFAGISTGRKSELYFNYIILSLASFLFVLKHTSGNILTATRQDLISSLIVAGAVVIAVSQRKKYLPSAYRE